MPVKTKLSKEHPLAIAWAKFKKTDEFENIKRWAIDPNHTVGSLWGTFEAGWRISVADKKECGDRGKAVDRIIATFAWGDNVELQDELATILDEYANTKLSQGAV